MLKLKQINEKSKLYDFIFIYKLSYYNLINQ